MYFKKKWRNGAAKKEAILRLAVIASEEEAVIAKLQAIEEYNLKHIEYNSQHNNTQLEAQHSCAVCRCPTTTRCSRCKAVRYCSGKCQITHWRQGHRDECQPGLALHARKKSEYAVEAASENQFNMNLKDETTIYSDSIKECDNSGSSDGSSFFSSTDQSIASSDSSINEDVKCQPAFALHASNREFVAETAAENMFALHMKDETKTCSGPSEESDGSGSSDSSVICFLSTTEQSEASSDVSVNEDVKLGTRIRPDQAPSVAIDSHILETLSGFDDAEVLSTSPPVYSVNSPLLNKIEKTAASKIDESLKSTNFKDKRKGSGVAVTEKSVPAEAEMGRTSSTEDWESQVQASMSRVMRTKPSKTKANNQMPNLEPSLKYSKSSKLLQSHEYRENELCNGKEARLVTSSMSSGNCQKQNANTRSPQVVSLDTEPVQILSQSTGKSLKTSVRKLAQHFRAPKQSKPYTSDMVKDPWDNHNHKVLFSIKIFMQLYSCDNVGLRPFGLVNCGNSCYANAVLQCLTFTRPITSYLLQGLHSKTCWKRDWCFICKFEHLIRKGKETKVPLSPVALLSQIQPIGREEDAHEFLRNVVDKMQSVCLEEAGVSGSSVEDSTLIGLTFGGYLRSKIKCMNCLGRSEKFDQMLDLTVEIDGDIYSLHEALGQFTMSETLGGDEKYKCNRCKSYQKAKKKLTVLAAPNILTIVLKRFRSGNFEKLNKLVQFPEVLDLLPYMSDTRDKYPIYHLYAVVVHLGATSGAYGGHYVSYVKNSQGHWFKTDDNRISRVDLETVLSTQAYILFYERQTPRGACLVKNGNMHSDGKTKNQTEAKNQKTKLSSSSRNAPHWMSPNDFTDAHAVDSEDWESHSERNSQIVDTTDSSSVFSASDAGSYSTDSTKDSSAEDLSGYLFGSSWYLP